MKPKNLLIYFIMFALLVTVGMADDSTAKGKKEDEKKAKQRQIETADASESHGEKVKNTKDAPFFKAVLQDQGKIYTSPFRMKAKDVLIWGGVAAITGVLIANDEKIYRDIKDYQAKHKWVDDVSPKVTVLGDGGVNIGIAGAFFLGGTLLKDKKAKETARLTMMTFIHTSLVVQLGKHIAGRQRPSQTGLDHWHGPSGFFDRYKKNQLAWYDAFPSGHTISIFGTATVISEMYKDTVWVPILSYTLATACGLSRVTEDTHWVSDVFLGAVLGYAIGKYIVKRRNRLGKGKFNVYPMASARQIGINVNYSF